MPKLQVGHIVTVSGFLSHVNLKEDEKVQSFEVKVEQINILGKTTIPVATQFSDTGKSILCHL